MTTFNKFLTERGLGPLEPFAPQDPTDFAPPSHDRAGVLRVTQAGQEPRDFDASIYGHNWFDRGGVRHLIVQEYSTELHYHWAEFTSPVVVEYLPE